MRKRSIHLPKELGDNVKAETGSPKWGSKHGQWLKRLARWKPFVYKVKAHVRSKDNTLRKTPRF